MPFQPGKSGNPGGRPQGVARALKAKYGDNAEKLLAELGKLALKADSDKVRLSAIVELLNRGWGKPTEHHEYTGLDGAPIDMTVIHRLSDANLRILKKIATQAREA